MTAFEMQRIPIFVLRFEWNHFHAWDVNGD